MRAPTRRTLVAFLVWAALAAGGQARAIPAEILATPAELAELVSQLATDKQWSASSRLQKLGAPAIAALIAHLRRDPFADRDHGTAREEAYLRLRQWWRGHSGNFKVNVRAAQIDAEIRM